MAYFYRIAVSLIFFGLAVYMFLSLPFLAGISSFIVAFAAGSLIGRRLF